MSDYPRPPPTRFGRDDAHRPKRRRIQQIAGNGGIQKLEPVSLCSIGDPSSSGRPTNGVLTLDGDDPVDTSNVAAAAAATAKKRGKAPDLRQSHSKSAAGVSQKQQVAAAAAAAAAGTSKKPARRLPPGRNSDRGSGSGRMGPLDIAKQNQQQGGRPIVAHSLKMKADPADKTSAIITQRIPRKGLSPTNTSLTAAPTFDPSMRSHRQPSLPNRAHNQQQPQAQHRYQQQVQQPLPAKSDEVCSIMDSSSDTEIEDAKPAAAAPTKKASKTTKKGLATVRSRTRICIDNNSSTSGDAESVGSDHSQDSIVSQPPLARHRNDASDSQALEKEKTRTRPLSNGTGMAIELENLFNRNRNDDDDDEVEWTSPPPNSHSRGREVLEVHDDDHDDDAQASGQKMLAAVKQSEGAVYFQPTQDDVPANDNRRLSGGLFSSVANGLTAVASTVASAAITGATLAFTKRNGKPCPVEAQKAIGTKSKKKPPATAIQIGASLTKDVPTKEEPKKSRINCANGFANPISLIDQRQEKDSESWWECSPKLGQVTIRTKKNLPRATEPEYRRSTRSKSKKYNEDFECDDSVQDDAPSTHHPHQPSRIAIGKKVSKGECMLEFTGDTLMFNCYISKGRVTRSKPNADKDLQKVRHAITFDDVRESKFFVWNGTPSDSDDSEHLKPFFAIKAKQTAANQLSGHLYSNAYQPDGTAVEAQYIVIEFNLQNEFDGLLAQMSASDQWTMYTNPSCRLEEEDAARYSASLVADSATSASASRFTKPKGKAAYPFLAGKDTILIYPFDGDKREIELAANELTCLGGSEMQAVSDEVALVANVSATSTDPSEEPNDAGKGKKISSGTVTLSADDYLLLEPGEWLNDNLIDFVLRWISRNNDGKESHFFSTHFYTKLADHGVDAVASWTSRKNRELNIFEKKMVFIPINQALHWSLCVIVNPGKIKEYIALKAAKADLSAESTEIPCILFFDSLKSHNKSQVRTNAYKWLNKEWERVTEDTSQPFELKSMRMYSPDVPRQNNFCDCGVFVCRYAYALYKISKVTSLKVCDAHSPTNGPHPFKTAITNAEVFKFDMSEIELLREQLLILIKKLHDIHQVFLKEKADREALEHIEGKQASSRMSTDSDAVVLTETLPDNGHAHDKDESALPVNGHTPPVLPKDNLSSGTQPCAEMICDEPEPHSVKIPEPAPSLLGSIDKLTGHPLDGSQMEVEDEREDLMAVVVDQTMHDADDHEMLDVEETGAV